LVDWFSDGVHPFGKPSGSSSFYGKFRAFNTPNDYNNNNNNRLAVYYFIMIIYWSLPSSSRQTFENLALDWQEYNTISVTTITFALGFYVTQSFDRWWNNWLNIPWIDPAAQAINAAVRVPKKKGDDSEEKALMIRRTLVRYLNLASALTFQTVSERVGSEYRGIESLKKIGLLTENEAREILNTSFDTHVYFIPITWAVNLATKSHEEGFINERMHEMCLKRIEQFRMWCGNLLAYKWVPIPLIYTQVITVAVYFYFLIELVGGQFLDPKKDYPGHRLDWGIPVFNIIMFVILVGWLKAAELMKHPFGLDEDAFELLWILNRNVDVGYNIVTQRFDNMPALTKDKFWSTTRPLGQSPRRPGATTLAFGAEHRHVDSSILSRSRKKSYADQLSYVSVGDDGESKSADDLNSSLL